MQSSLGGGRAAELLAALTRDDDFAQTAAGRAWLGDLAALIGAENRREDLQTVLTRDAAPQADPAVSRTVLLGLGRGLARARSSLRTWLEGPTSDALHAAFARTAETARSDQPASARVEAVRLLGLGPEDLALETLPDLLDARQPSTVQLAALQALSDQSDPRVGPAITARWKALGPSLRREAAEVLMARRDRIAALLDALGEKQILTGDLDPARRSQLLAHPDKAIQERAKTLLGGEVRSDRSAILAAYQPALTLKGDRARGQVVFRENCATCHKAGGEGQDVAPDLATVAGRTAEDLLVHILDPNREVAPAYLNYAIATTDGRVLTGLIAGEAASTVTLKRSEGASDVVPRDQIDALTSTGLSLMPEGLEKTIDPQAMADLIAFLRGLTPPDKPQ